MSHIIYQGKTKSGKDLTIRYPLITDAEQLTEYINKLSLEQTFIRFQGEQQTVDQERDWIQSFISKIQNSLGMSLYALIDNQIIGVCDINMRGSIESHIGVFGLTVAQGFRNEGIGALLLKTMLKQAHTTIPQLKIVELSVFANNPAAINLYEKYGFKEFGRLPNGILHRGEYIDHIYMFKELLDQSAVPCL